jgi:hypothetical protein
MSRKNILRKWEETISKAGFKNIDEVEMCLASVKAIRPSINKLRLLHKLVTPEDIEEARQEKLRLESIVPQLFGSIKLEA